MRALVTGGAGFIGSTLVDRLLDAGDEVAVVDDLSTGREANLAGALARGARLHRADVTVPDELAAAFAAARPEVVFHLAAQIDVRRSVADPAADAAVNVLGTINVLEAARRAGAGRLVNVSTGGAIYGADARLPASENAAALPAAPYGQSKLCAEGYCALYARAYGLPTLTLRLSNVYGPRQDPLGEAGVVAIFCGCLERGEHPTIYGDGTQTRDYVYVDDVAGALLAARDHPGAVGPVNVGTGRETSVLDLLRALEACRPSDAGLEPRFAPARAGELARSCLDVARAREMLGWSATVALGDGLRRTLDWTRAQAGG